MLQNDLATRIVDLREKNNINQTELAKKLGLEKSVIPEKYQRMNWLKSLTYLV